MTMTLKAEIRSSFTRSATRQLRLSRKVPAVIYGKTMDPLPIALDQKEVQLALQHPNALLALDMPGYAFRSVVVHDVQRDPLDHTIRAVDLHLVDLTERVRAHVPLTPLPDPEGKIIPYQMFLHELLVEGLPDRIPEAVPLDLAPVRQSRAVLVRDLPVPADLHVLTHPDEVVAAPFVPRGEAAEEKAE
ncbi:50S ribosomal protein L25 [Gorillibacterium sp. sgz5001074]|uniref:50S ribosomal protein L25 n=1 Tax=Gorillibacterium sp. sgz5001074 TaxID=3446695 RepID=UPI003F667D99